MTSHNQTLSFLISRQERDQMVVAKHFSDGDSSVLLFHATRGFRLRSQRVWALLKTDSTLVHVRT